MSRFLTTLLRYLHPHSAVAFWHTSIGPVRYDYGTLDDYYIDLRAKPAYEGPYDSAGIPVLNYFGLIGKQYNPCAIAQWGLGAYQLWKRGDVESERLFLRAADWLVDNLDVDEQDRGFWWYGFDLGAYGLKKPWASALAQAQGISLLLRAHAATGRKHYLQIADRACRAMLSPVEDGGLLLRHDGNTFLEEAVADRPTAILDGLIFAIFGLRDYCLVNSGDVSASSILEECLSTIERLLPRYDLGYWSRADLYADNPPMPASGFYHGLHVAQLRVLADLTGTPAFSNYSQRWADMSTSPLKRTRAFFKKVVFKFTYY
jgi:heparosan-N-sulfate-glucuronate 5-epimerase